MKSLPILTLIVSLTACTPKTDSLIGTWTVDKVHVQFDESRATPELVRQTGDMERKNSFSINSDSILVFKGLEEEWRSKTNLRNDTLFLEGTAFGVWKDGRIVTRIGSPLGEVVVTYKKE